MTNEEIHKSFMKELEALMIKHNVEISHDEFGMCVDYVSSQPSPNIIWHKQVGYQLYPGCNAFEEIK